MSTHCDIHTMPPRFVLRSSDKGDLFCCPVCACPHVHARQVSVEQGRTLTEVENETTYVTATDHGETSTGSMIGLQFWCERGHRFHYLFRFEDGVMKIDQYWLPHLDREYRNELWRPDCPESEI